MQNDFRNVELAIMNTLLAFECMISRGAAPQDRWLCLSSGVVALNEMIDDLFFFYIIEASLRPGFQ